MEIIGLRYQKLLKINQENKFEKDPKINHEPFTEYEDKQIINLYYKIGTSWSKISKFLINRPENMIKNRFYSHIKKKYDLDYASITNTSNSISTSQRSQSISLQMQDQKFEPQPAITQYTKLLQKRTRKDKKQHDISIDLTGEKSIRSRSGSSKRSKSNQSSRRSKSESKSSSKNKQKNNLKKKKRKFEIETNGLQNVQNENKNQKNILDFIKQEEPIKQENIYNFLDLSQPDLANIQQIDKYPKYNIFQKLLNIEEEQEALEKEIFSKTQVTQQITKQKSFDFKMKSLSPKSSDNEEQEEQGNYNNQFNSVKPQRFKSIRSNKEFGNYNNQFNSPQKFKSKISNINRNRINSYQTDNLQQQRRVRFSKQVF